jgi:hypothetical protein
VPIPPDTELGDSHSREAMIDAAALFASPLIWFLCLVVSYWSNGEKCVGVSRAWLTALLAAAGLVCSALGLRFARKLRLVEADIARHSPGHGRRHFVAWLGISLSAFCLVASWMLLLPLWVLESCE